MPSFTFAEWTRDQRKGDLIAEVAHEGTESSVTGLGEHHDEAGLASRQTDDFDEKEQLIREAHLAEKLVQNAASTTADFLR